MIIPLYSSNKSDREIPAFAGMTVETLAMALAIAGGALALMLPVLVNGFPFIFPDSGDYLVFTPRLYRSPFYGLLIAFFHLNHFIWGPVIMQALVASHLIRLTLRITVPSHLPRNFIIAIVLLTLFSSLPIFVGFIMADIFTAIMCLTLYLIGFHFSAFGRYTRIYLLLLCCIATAANIANLTLAVLLLPLIITLRLWCGASLLPAVRQAGWLVVPIVLTATAVLLNNVVVHRIFSLTPAGQSFFMANLIEYGPATQYLKKACPEAGYKICIYADKFPIKGNDLLWSGMYDRLGGFSGMREESRAIVAATLKQYSLEVASIMARNFLTALMTHEPGEELEPEVQVASMAPLLEQKFGSQAAAAYLSSMEMQGRLPHALLKHIDDVVFPAALLALILFAVFYARKKDGQGMALAVFVLSSFLCNAALCACLSGVFNRYQARVSWLVVFAAIILTIRLPEIVKKVKNE